MSRKLAIFRLMSDLARCRWSFGALAFAILVPTALAQNPGPSPESTEATTGNAATVTSSATTDASTNTSAAITSTSPSTTTTAIPTGTVEVPNENKVKGTMPSLAGAEQLAQKLLEAIRRNDVSQPEEIFFPAATFMALKSIPHAKDYYGQLIKTYEADIHKAHIRLTDFPNPEFVALKTGTCRWKEAGSEYNKIPYWSCYRNHIRLSTSKGDVSVDVKTMINWGQSWYVTHLGGAIKPVSAEKKSKISPKK